MENLEVLRLSGTFFQNNLPDVKQVIAINDGILVYNDTKLILYENERPNDEIIIFEDSEDDKIKTDVQYLRIDGKLWFGTSKYFYFYKISDRTLSRVNISFEYIFASWNPIEDTIIVVDSELRVTALLFDNTLEEFSVIASCSLHEAPKVGADRSPPGIVNPGIIRVKENATCTFMDDIPLPTNDGITITWQDDCKYYAIGYMHEDDRLFKVLKYPAEVHYIAQYPLGMQESIAWRPVRNMIAAHVHTYYKSWIGLYEKNGQLLTKFDLTNKDKVVDINWSSDGYILMLLQQNSNGSYITLYTTRNMEWYLKQCLEFSDKRIISTEFVDTEENVYKLRINLNIGSLEYIFKKSINRNNEGVCAVICGTGLQIYDFKKTITPPPYTHKTITTLNPINMIIFGKDGNLLAVDSKNIFHWFSLNDNDKVKEVKLPSVSCSYPLSVKPFLWEGTTIYCNNTNEDLSDNILDFDLVKKSTNSTQEESEIDQTISKHPISTYDDNPTKVYRETESTINYEIQVIDGNYFKIHQTTMNTLFLNNSQIATDINSFMFHSKYLLVTTNDGKLYGIQLDKNELFEACMKRDISQWYMRDIEPGSILINGIPNTSKVILQMIRGNLEVIRIDLVGIVQVEDLLKEQKWKEAVDMIRLDKLNSNVLIDLDPERFLKNVNVFVDSVQYAKVINSILLEMQDGNTLKNYRLRNINITDLKDKKKVVCDAVVNFVRNLDCATYVTTIMICCYIRNDYNTMFNYIAEFLEDDNINLAKEAINTALLYTEGITLFKLSLDTYNIKVIQFVATNVQLDPLQYEHIIKSLQKAQTSDGGTSDLMFTINDYLERYHQALFTLLFRRDVDWNQILEYTRQHKLYKLAYSFFYKTNILNRYKNEYKIIAIDYAEHLKRHRQFDEAALVYTKLKSYQEAYDCYKSALDWTNALFVLDKLDCSDDDRISQYEIIATEMIKVGQPKEASKIYIDYCKSFDRALNVLIVHDLFIDAVQLAKQHKNEDALCNVVYPALLKSAKQLFTSLNSHSTDLSKYVNRLRVLRENKTNNLLKPEPSISEDYSEVMSDTESVKSNRSTLSNKSHVTTASEKYKRKQELKKQDLRENGIYEDIALMRIIHITMTDIINLTKDVKLICTLLIEGDDGNFEFADSLQTFTINLYQEMEKYCTEVWPPYLYGVDDTDFVHEILKRNFAEIDERYSKAPDLPLRDCLTLLTH